MRRQELTLGLISCLAIVQIHCGGQSKFHPTPENIPDATDASLVIDLSDLDQWEEGPLFPDTTGFTSAHYGSDDGPEHEFLSWVQDVAHDGQGTIFILDANPGSDATTSVRVVHMVSKSGQHLGILGRRGMGPGEFMNPRKLLVAEQGNALLVLGWDRHIDIFRRDESGSFSYSERLNMPTGVNEACIMRDHLYYLQHDADTGHSIQKFTLDGQHVMGFGAPYKSRNPTVVESLSGNGRIICNEDQGVLGFVRSYIPVLTGFDENGGLLWRIKVDGVSPQVGVEEWVRPDGSLGIQYDVSNQFEKGRGQLLPSVARGDGNIYLTVSVSTGNKQSRSLLFRVDAQTGAWQHIGRGMMPAVAEKDLLVSMPSNSAEVIQVQIRSRSD